MQEEKSNEIESYDFSITGVIKAGFDKAEGNKLTFIGAFFIYIIIAVIVEVILEVIFPEAESPINVLIKSILALPITLPIMVGLTMLGVKRARDESLNVSSIFDYFNKLGPILLAYIVMLVMLVLGFLLLIIPGIYLAVSYTFVYPLVVDKGLDVWEAMELSRKTVSKQWFKFFGLGIVSGLIIIISIIPLGIGLIWSLPAVYIVYGLMYRNLFDDENQEDTYEQIEETPAT